MLSRGEALNIFLHIWQVRITLDFSLCGDREMEEYQKS